VTDTDRWRVLLIDDEKDVRDVVSLALKDAGYETVAACNGPEGIRLWEELGPQIVITDIRMPGMDGLQVLETIKGRGPDTEVIVATAFGEMDVAVRALQLDASDFITKPIDDKVLRLALTRARDRHASRRSLRDYATLLERENARTARELSESIALQKGLIESSMDGILACDANGRARVCNRRLEQMLGLCRGEVLHVMGLEDFLAQGDAVRLKEALEAEGFGGKGRLFLYETTLVGAGRRTIPVQVSAVHMGGAQGRGLVCFFRDLRQIRALEREMSDQVRVLHQDKMMSLGRLAASIVHEINNPLSGILNYVRLMLRTLSRGPLSEEKRGRFLEYLRLMESETERCSQVVSGLLTFSRKSVPSLGEVLVDDLLDRCMILCRHKLDLHNIRLVRAVESGLAPVWGDFTQLQQCVINLLFNAMDAMPRGGTLTITAGRDPSGRAVALAVEDTGQGIAPEDLPHIFEPFFTTKAEGHGLGMGLSTVYAIMEQHGGTVTVRSEAGKGSAFTLRIPSGSAAQAGGMPGAGR